ncbi:hypothetical protein [Extibacter muris]|uniref:Transposase n=1 Tax=Extibacter muris TaxID=1796622 RepID=A0A4R4F8U9_9FIRM|nr:hypothetical protein [Extibacter muris]MCU0081165.1 DUF2254 domain-containing protein [Extibacter muris]TDA20162.1 hypothetical protein E1963_18635 [Extibacter muris]
MKANNRILILAALVMLNYFVNTSNTLIQNTIDECRCSIDRLYVIQERLLVETEAEEEKGVPHGKKVKYGTGQILKDIKRINKKSISAHNEGFRFV